MAGQVKYLSTKIAQFSLDITHSEQWPSRADWPWGTNGVQFYLDVEKQENIIRVTNKSHISRQLPTYMFIPGNCTSCTKCKYVNDGWKYM